MYEIYIPVVGTILLVCFCWLFRKGGLVITSHAHKERSLSVKYIPLLYTLTILGLLALLVVYLGTETVGGHKCCYRRIWILFL